MHTLIVYKIVKLLLVKAKTQIQVFISKISEREFEKTIYVAYFNSIMQLTTNMKKIIKRVCKYFGNNMHSKNVLTK